jgi:hypothetical protein
VVRCEPRNLYDAIRAVVADLLADADLAVPPDVALALVDGSVVGWLLDDAGGADALVSRVAAALALLPGPPPQQVSAGSARSRALLPRAQSQPPSTSVVPGMSRSMVARRSA